MYHSSQVTYVSVDPSVATYVSAINHGGETEILRFKTYVPGSIPVATIKFFFNILVIMCWTLSSIYMQFEYQYLKSCNVSVEHVQLLRGMFISFVARGMFCLKLV